MFKLANTFTDPAAGANPQRGFPSIGAEEQTTGPASPHPGEVPWKSDRPTKGWRSWFMASSTSGSQRGFPTPLKPAQRRPRGSMPASPPIFGGVHQQWTPYYSRGAAAFVPNFGKVLTNPIGAGVVALHRTQASYGPSAVYENGAIWWVSQIIPTSIHTQSLTDPAELAALLGMVQVQAVVRTTG